MISSNLKNIIKKTSKLSFFILINKPIGLLRDILQNRYFGISLLGDAYVIAWKTPNVLRRIFGEGLLANILLPDLVTISKNEDNKTLLETITLITIIMQALVACFCVIIFFYSKNIITLLSPGALARIEYGENMLKILIFFTFFFTWSAIQSVVVQLKRNFYIGPQSQFILNICLATEFYIGSTYSIYYQKIALFIALNGIIVLLLNTFAFGWYGFSYRIPTKKSLHYTYSFFKKFFLALSTNLFLESNSFLGLSISSYLKPGLLTLFELLLTLIRIPQQICGNALATTINLDIINCINDKKKDTLQDLLDAITILFTNISLLFIWGVHLYGELFFTIFFSYAAISKSYIFFAAKIFFLMSLSLLPTLLTRIFTTIIYAHKDVLITTLLSFSVTIFQNIILVLFIKKHGIITLGISYFLCDWIRFFLFYFFIQKKYDIYISKKKILEKTKYGITFILLFFSIFSVTKNYPLLSFLNKEIIGTIESLLLITFFLICNFIKKKKNFFFFL